MNERKRLTKEEIWDNPLLSILEKEFCDQRHYDGLDVVEALDRMVQFDWFRSQATKFSQSMNQIETLKGEGKSPVYVHAVLFLFRKACDYFGNSILSRDERAYYFVMNSKTIGGLDSEIEKAARLAWPEIAERFTWESFEKQLELLPTKEERLDLMIARLAEFRGKEWQLPYKPSHNFDGVIEYQIYLLKDRIRLDPKNALSNPEQLTKPVREMKNAELVLLFHYGLKFLGIEGRKQSDLAPLAKFLHLLVGGPISKIDNSDLYQKFKRTPLIHETPQRNIQELEKAKKSFEAAGMKEVIPIIEKDIQSIRNEEK